MTTIYILLPVHNRCQTTQKFIQCLSVQTYHNYHLVLIDDGSTDGTEEIVRNRINNLSVIRGNGNWWWAGSLHQAYLWLKKDLNIKCSDLILMINDDSQIDPNFLETGVEIMSDKKHTFLGAKATNIHTQETIPTDMIVDWSKLSFDVTDCLEEIDCLSTNGLFFYWEDFQKVGGFYPKLLPHYTSDYEFTLRAKRIGMNLTTDSRLKLYWDITTTGYHNINELHSMTFIAFFKSYFSNKNPHNPIALTFFVALACPYRWKLLNWLRIWRAVARQIAKYIYDRHFKKLFV